MRGAFTLAICFFIASAPVLAAESVSAATTFSKRQLSECMSKRMIANRTLSYNDAAKACKDQLRGNKTDAALNNAPKPVS